MKASERLALSPEVRSALAAGEPVVALESTIISHGMPYPHNVEMALSVEALVRAEGAVPATIAISDGRVRVGLNEAELNRLASADALKVSRRDLPYVLATGTLGATTVAATMICASLAGIRVFATGGVGGVHRGGEDSLDISADLQELARTSVAVVCAGVKSILDIGRTLEVLETLGVPVIGYGSDAFPAFYTRDSGFGVDYRLDTPEAVAQLLKLKWDLGLEGGVLLANPVPAADEMSERDVTTAIGRALAELDDEGVGGKAVTPYLLSRIVELTQGESLRTNIALVKNNAHVAAQLALALAT